MKNLKEKQGITLIALVITAGQPEQESGIRGNFFAG